MLFLWASRYDVHQALDLGDRWLVQHQFQIADFEMGQLRHVPAIFAGIDKKRPASCADAANGAWMIRLNPPILIEPRELAC